MNSNFFYINSCREPSAARRDCFVLFFCRRSLSMISGQSQMRKPIYETRYFALFECSDNDDVTVDKHANVRTHPMQCIMGWSKHTGNLRRTRSPETAGILCSLLLYEACKDRCCASFPDCICLYALRLKSKNTIIRCR